MSFVRLAWLVPAVVLTACGSSSFDVTADFDDSGDADDGASSEAAIDGDLDATVDSSADDTGDPDSSVPDSTTVDTGVVDSSVLDTTVVDTTVVDTTVVDTSVADTAVADTAVADTTPIDTGADTGPVCTPAPESCNGVDDDCNGVIDDGVPIVPCGVGACRVTPATACTAGKPTICVPGTPAGSDTTCNGIDDDCNGVVDDGCIVCARYVLAGSSGTGLTAATPIGTIQAAINSMTAAGAKGNVCVASSAPAGVCVGSTYTERVTMAEGISVFGNYKPGTAWTRGDPACVTSIVDLAAATPQGTGVYFGHALTNATQLDGFTVNGVTNSSGGAASAAITIQGGATITNNIVNGGTISVSYGIHLTAPSSATLPAPVISNNTITGGSSGIIGTVSTSVGVRINNLAPVLRNNRAISGGIASNNSRGIEMSGSARGSQIIDNALITGGQANLAVGIDASGDLSTVTIARNTITSGSGATQARAVSFLSCNTSSGRASIVQNVSISASGNSGVATQAIAVQNGAATCAVLIDGNAKIVGKSSGGSNATAVYCTGSGTACTVSNNARVAGFDGTTTGGSGRGVHFQANAGGAIRGNASIVGCPTGSSSTAGCVGAHLESATATVVDGNVFEINRGNYPAGVRVRWTNANIRNNLVWVDGGSGIELDVRPSSGGFFEAIVHSNTVIAPSTPVGTPPITQLLVVDNETTSGPPNGVFRNNLAICQGTGFNRTAFREFGTFGDPRVLENNDFFGCATLYGDRETGNLTSIAAINALVDVPLKANNVTLDPAFIAGNFHLSATSPVIDLGTSAGCPTVDFDNQSRPAKTTCDIGADEVP